MKRLLLLPLALLLLSGICSHAVLGCSLVVPPIKDFDATEYVFIGEVTGVVGPLSFEHVRGETWGLIVRVDEKVYLPSQSGDSFEIFPFSLQPDGSWSGWSSEDLLRSYPVGSQVRVIAAESKLLDGRSANGNIRLAIPPLIHSIVRNEWGGQRLTSAKSVYNYREFEGRYREFVASIGESNARGVNPLHAIYRRLPEFELRKDLRRLKKARTEAERQGILERLACYPLTHIDYPEIVSKYVANEGLQRRLLETRDEWLRKRPHNN